MSVINAIEYETSIAGVTRLLRADKNVMERNAWHLKTIEGNGLPPVSLLGDNSYNVAGKSFQGMAIDGREISLELYADGYSALGLQNMLDEARRTISLHGGNLGVLRLENSAGARYRIPAYCTGFDEALRKQRTSLVQAVFDCPFSWFEDDMLTISKVFAVTGGKEYPLDRPYTFGELTAAALTQTVEVTNNGDISAPVTVKLNGSSMTAVTITNNTTGATITVSGASGVSGIEVCTDVNNLYAKFADNTDASRYVSMACHLADFVLIPGTNSITIAATATSITPASTVIEHRGRFSTCL